VERVVASYEAEGHDVDVIEVVDDDVTWCCVIVDGELLPAISSSTDHLLAPRSLRSSTSGPFRSGDTSPAVGGTER
jgi:hypothetical protein